MAFRSLPSFVNPEVHVQERNTDGEGGSAALESEKGSSAEKEDEVYMSVGAEETVTSCASLFYHAVYSSLVKVSRRSTSGDTPERLESQSDGGEPVHAIDMV